MRGRRASRRAGAGQALLPDRLPTETDEDTLGIAELGRRCVEIGHSYHRSVTVTPRSGASCPSRRPRSSGSARTPSPSCGARSTCCVTPPGGARLTLRWHEPEATAVEGIASRGTGARCGDRTVWRAGGTFQEWSEHFDLGLWTDALAAEVSASTRPSTETETSTSTRLDHISAGLHRTSCDRLLDALPRRCRGLRWTPV